METKHILIIEDNISVLASYMEILESTGLDVIPLVAPTYEKAKTIFSMEPIDLIILDLVLPGTIATSVLADLRSKYPEIPIFVVTGHPEQLDQEQVRQFAITQFFTKPFRVETFCQALQSSLHAPRRPQN